ncbi:MAG: family N-acetyltransferase [Thermomicrobiales bacterium]|nr:family N-acetyltransferase [Thermomicrobiales bacterium]
MTAPPASRLPPPVSLGIEVVRAISSADRLAAFEIRRRVFAEEQDVADLRVSDQDDARSIIALASLIVGDRGERVPVSTGRLTPPVLASDPGLIAWVATIPEARGRGAGFYERLGFIPAGPIYDVRGIPHRRMIRLR